MNTPLEQFTLLSIIIVCLTAVISKISSVFKDKYFLIKRSDRENENHMKWWKDETIERIDSLNETINSWDRKMLEYTAGIEQRLKNLEEKIASK